MKCDYEGCENKSEYYTEGKNLCEECRDSLAEVVENFGANDLIIFEENLTPARLAEISEESKTWPIVLSTKIEYDEGYERHQRFKRTSVSLRKKADEFRKQARADLKTGLEKIDTDLQVYLDVIEPIIKKLGASRQRWDEEEEAYKMNIAEDEAKRQRAEFERQEMIRTHVQALDENALFDHRKKLEEKEKRLEKNRIEAQRDLDEAEAWGIYNADKKECELLAAAAKLEREKYEFECEKSRLDFDACWNYYYPDDHPLKTDLGKPDQGKGVLCSDYPELTQVLRLDFDDAWEEAQDMYLDLNTHKIDVSSESDTVEDIQEEIDNLPADAPQSSESAFNSWLICDEIKELILGDIEYLESCHAVGLENQYIQIELGNLISRVKLNLQVFTDAVNEQKEEEQA